MPTRDVLRIKDPRLETDDDWVVSYNKRSCVSIILWGMPRELSTLEIRGKLADIGLVGFARGSIKWEGDHVRLVLKPSDSKGLSKEVVTRISACLRSMGCRCVLDNSFRGVIQDKPVVGVQCVNRFEVLTSNDSKCVDGGIDITILEDSVKAVEENKYSRKLRVGTWNFSGLCSERKQKEVGQVLNKLNLDVVAGQESWEREGYSISVDEYRWFGKPRSDQKSPRGEGGVGFLIRECLVDEVEFIRMLSVLKVCG